MMMMMRNPSSLSSSCEGGGPAKKIVVAVNAVAASKEKDIPRLALKWVLDEVANPATADSILFLALASAVKPPARKGWAFPILAGDCANAAKKEQDKTPRRKSFSSQMRDAVETLCNQMIQTLQPKVKIKVKVVPADSPGIVAVESSKARAAWVVLDKQLKREEKHCMEELQCTVVAMKRSGAKSLRVPLVREYSAKSLSISGEGLQKEAESQSQGTRNSCCEGKATKHCHGDSGGGGGVVVVVEGVASMSSPDMEHPFTATETTTSSATSSEQEASPLPTSRGRRQLPKPLEARPDDTNYDLCTGCDAAATAEAAAESDSDRSNPNLLPNNWARPDSRTKLGTKVWEAANSSSFRSRDRLSCFSVCEDPCGANVVQSCSSPRVVNMKHDPKLIPNNNKNLNLKMMMMHKEKYAKFDQGTNQQQQVNDLDRTSSVRKAVSLNRSPPPVPPPLCSICQHKSPIIGKPPRWFSYSELEYATNGFSRDNFLAEGGFGSVYKGVLSDGQVVAVKQHKHASSQGDMEFCSEVEVLSCAQHRNVVMLIGFCTEDQRRLLVYEYVCNGSLDHHIYGREQNTLEWSARYKIAIGAARGLRYLHEECRVGCIVHRDLRPNNILLTHDFEPMVGDFGLARWQPDGDLGVETRVIGTLGYLAPEYAQSGQITEKADVFSFGVVLLEIVTGRRAVDITKPRGQQCLAEWARPLLEENAVAELVDPRLQHDYSEHEAVRVLHAAALCIRKDPFDRPRMSRVNRILEGDVMYPNSSSVLPHYDAVCRSRMSVHSPTTAPPLIRDEI